MKRIILAACLTLSFHSAFAWGPDVPEGTKSPDPNPMTPEQLAEVRARIEALGHTMEEYEIMRHKEVKVGDLPLVGDSGSGVPVSKACQSDVLKRHLSADGLDKFKVVENLHGSAPITCEVTETFIFEPAVPAN